MKLSSIFVIVAIFLISASCAESSIEYQVGQDNICFATRGDDIGGTYRVMVYYNNLAYLGSGTYVDSVCNDQTILVPWALDNEGHKIENSSSAENKAAGLPSTCVGYRHLQCVKPGKINDGASFSFCPAQEALYISDPEMVTIGKYVPQKIKNPLIDRRSKISFNFYTYSDSKEDITIGNPQLWGAGGLEDNVVYYPAQKLILAGTNPMRFNLVGGNGKISDDGKWELLYTSDVNFVTSGYYCTKKDLSAGGIDYTNYEIDGVYLFLLFEIRQSNREDVSLRIPLTEIQNELKPMSEYVFNLYVKSELIKVSLEIYSHEANSRDWENVTFDNQNIGSSEATVINIGTWDITGSECEWQLPDEDLKQEI